MVPKSASILAMSSGDDGLVGDVCHVTMGLKAQLAVVLLGLGDLVGVTCVKGDLGAGLSERLGNGHTDAIGGAGYERDLAHPRRKLSIRSDIAILSKETFIYISLAFHTRSV